MSNARFSVIPAWIVTDARLKGSDLKVLCLLGTYTNKEGWCRRSQVKMAEQLNCGRSTVQDSLNRLAEIGAVEKRRVESADGRDSAHWYRVVLDRAVASNAFAAWEAEDEEEFGPISAANDSTPPAGIPAPPAGPRPAPPAGSGPAPINERSLTISSNEVERERDCDEEENPKAIERAFKRFFLGWKTAISDSEPEARRCWSQLSGNERTQAAERSADYQAAALSTGRKHLCSAATYLRERRWEKLQAAGAQTQSAAPEVYTAYSRAGRGLLFAELLKPERHLQLTALEEMIIRDKPEKTDVIWRDKREKQGWPEAVRLIETTVQRRRFSVPARIVELCQDFQKVKVGSAEWEAWRALHQRRCWPWLPAPDGLEWMQFPPFPADLDAGLDDLVEEALANFQRKMTEVRGNDDAA